MVPSDDKLGQRESKVRVRAHFDYDPDNDPYIPCKEAGLGFKRGEILHIVSQDDAYWWQARKEFERTARAGLIPSRALQERRIIHERKQLDSNENNDGKKSEFHPIPTSEYFRMLIIIFPLTPFFFPRCSMLC